MSKLAHSNEVTMQAIETRRLYDKLGSCNELFETFDAEMVEPDIIEETCGAGVLREYMHWIYLNIK